LQLKVKREQIVAECGVILSRCRRGSGGGTQVIARPMMACAYRMRVQVATTNNACTNKDPAEAGLM